MRGGDEDKVYMLLDELPQCAASFSKDGLVLSVAMKAENSKLAHYMCWWALNGKCGCALIRVDF